MLTPKILFEKVVSTMILLVPSQVNGVAKLCVLAYPTTGVKFTGATTCVSPVWNADIEFNAVIPILTWKLLHDVTAEPQPLPNEKTGN